MADTANISQKKFFPETSNCNKVFLYTLISD
jgi:hypothetical protein